MNQRLKDDKLMIEADFTESHKTEQLHAIQIEYFWNHCFGISKEIYNSKLSDMIATESVTTLTWRSDHDIVLSLISLQNIIEDIESNYSN